VCGSTMNECCLGRLCVYVLERGAAAFSGGYEALADVHLVTRLMGIRLLLFCLYHLVQQSRNGCGSPGGVAWQQCWVKSL